ncbi:PREDICTED: protein DEK-like [Brassica oleracea var. oleracea]|uniref:DEK-C domain-containing protein n=1 Tax=Brassica oleracea var. oleracea TaxID=109376 RepID=A0A0D3BG90_BRAOL|nr:PREDICTED: protein DEK-like [Brassica oleracea var. oleracea]
MATETEAVESPVKKDGVVANSVKETEKKEAPVSDDGDSEGEKTGKENESPVTPVTERPKRTIKKVEPHILHTPSSRSSRSKPVSVQQGRGTQLKEIPNVAYKLSKRKPDDNLFLLHTILYGKKGKVQTLKRNIGLFSGFVWSEQEEEKQRARTKEKIEKCIKDKLIDFCDVLDIPINKSNVKKEELVVSVLEFLLCPKATRDVVLTDPEKETKKRKKSTAKNVTSGESSDVPAKRRRQTKESGNKQDQPSKSEDTETEDEKDKAEEKKSTSKKNSSKRTKEKPAAEEEKSLKGSARSGRKSSLKVVKSTSSSSKKQKVDKDDSSKEKGKKQTSKPQAKGSKDQGKASKKGNKREPTRKEMHVVVAKILKEVDFNTATLSDILRKLGSHFGVDLMHRKTEVKDIITDAIDEMSVDDEREENTEDEG